MDNQPLKQPNEQEINDHHKKRPGCIYFYLTVFASNLLAFMVGVSVTWTSPVVPKLKSENWSKNPLGYAITTAEASWIGSLYGLGGILGPLISCQVANRWGRRRCVILCGGIPFAFAFYSISLSGTVWLYYLGRFVMGVAASSTYVVIPMYNAEISEVSVRGTVCSLMATFEMSGALFSYVIGFYVSIPTFCAILGSIASISTIADYFILPESPYYLIANNRYSKARESLTRLRSTNNIDEEFKQICSNVEDSNRRKISSVRKFFASKTIRRAQLMILGLMFFQLWSGIVPVIFYVQTIFKQSEIDFPPHISAIIVGFTKFTTTFFTSSVVDKFGRKPLLYISATGMMISEFVLGGFFYLKYIQYDVGKLFWLPIVCLEGYIFSYIAGFGPLVWTMMAEVFPIEAKSIATTISCCFFWVMLFITSKSLDLLCDPLGIVICFWCFSACCALALVFVRIYVIETKGKNLQEIRQLLEK